MKHAFVVAALLALGASCTTKPGPGSLDPVTAETHRWFPVTPAASHALGKVMVDGTLGCESCHPPATESFTDATCVGCHKHGQAVTDRLHTSVQGYSAAEDTCVSCHPQGAKVPYDHAGIMADCAQCHDLITPFAALPKAGFSHPGMGGSDCGACHVTATWHTDGGLPAGLSADPSRTVVVDSLIPTYSGTHIISVSPLAQPLSMWMSHTSAAVPAAAFSACANCHSSGASYLGGDLHSSLTTLGLPQPTACLDCHATAPRGFVGPLATAPTRDPASGEMKHDAVGWTATAPTTTKLVTQDCALCHRPPSQAVPATWATNIDGGALANYHGPLGKPGQSQPGSCLDCHANSRPTALLTLDGGLRFDHEVAPATEECARCHTKSAPAFTSWSQGQYHFAGATNPATCLPCHAGERPTSTTGWRSTTYTASPFDYGTNAAGVTHGAGQDCAGCHPGPGTGAWGGTQNWQAGHFPHGPNTAAATTCSPCHSTQRPDLLPGATAPAMATLLGFDHALNGTGDCYGCHQASVRNLRYTHLFNPATGVLPGGDWREGQDYPGATLVTGSGRYVTVNETVLNRGGPNNLVVSTSAVTSTLDNAMLHTSGVVPSEISPGPAGSPVYAQCWHCHTHVDGGVTSYANGVYHAALNTFATTPGGTPSPLPQPTSGCTDCHTQMRPARIVMKQASALEPMDHWVTFTAPTTIAGTSYTRTDGIPCFVCHANPGNSWADGTFHPRVDGGVPQDCTVCHYPLMADAARADLTSGTRYAMKHRSPQLTFQTCDTCHAQALGRATTTPLAATQWQGGSYHPSLTTQPTACNECHAVSVPARSTQSTSTYALPQGGTATNGRQWMNHASPAATGKDCASCHLMDAKRSGSTWSQATNLHAQTATPATCNECHGLTNGMGSVVGTNNNLPQGLTDSATVTSAAATPSTGVPAGTLDQISHTDVNVTGKDCKLCHTQAGRVASGPTQGKEWKQATFHRNFGTANPLVMNGTTGRCSTCHMNVKPRASFTTFDHAPFVATSGTSDCSTCHTWPGTGTAAAPNWKGAAAVPAYISVGGFTVPAPPATTPYVQTGIANLPHPAVPTGTPCTACHAQAAGGRRAKGYDHLSTLINGKCNTCHETGSDLVETPWNGATTRTAGAGDTRCITLATVPASFHGNSRNITYPKHFFPIDCYQCHEKPPGNGLLTTGAAYLNAWRFLHPTSRMTNPSTCVTCHTNGIPD